MQVAQKVQKQLEEGVCSVGVLGTKALHEMAN